MLKSYRNKLAMYKTVETILQANGQSWSGLPAFVTAKQQFTYKLSQLETHVYAQETVLHGVTADKRLKRREAAKLTVEVAKAIQAYAASQGNPGLAESVKVSVSGIVYTTHVRSINLMDEVIEKATEHLGALEDFGVNQVKLDALETKRDEVKLAVGSPRQALLSRKIATESIKKTIKEIDAILRGQIDNLVESLKWTSPEFHLFYINARHVMKHGNRHNGEGDEGAGADNERSTQYDGDDE